MIVISVIYWLGEKERKSKSEKKIQKGSIITITEDCCDVENNGSKFSCFTFV